MNITAIITCSLNNNQVSDFDSDDVILFMSVIMDI